MSDEHFHDVCPTKGVGGGNSLEDRVWNEITGEVGPQLPTGTVYICSKRCNTLATPSFLRDQAEMDQKRQELLQHLQSAQALADELHDELAHDPSFRKEVTQVSRTILRKVQLPFERAWEIFTFQNVMASLRLSLEAGWLDHVAKASTPGVAAVTVSEETGSDEALSNRIMRLLATAGIIDEVDVRTYARNGLTIEGGTGSWAIVYAAVWIDQRDGDCHRLAWKEYSPAWRGLKQKVLVEDVVGP